MSRSFEEYKIKIQEFGAVLSAMVMPNIPAFIAWGILTALFIPTGWMPNEELNNIIGPTLKFLMPILIGYTGGYNIYGKRGGVAGAIATIGVVIGADITMLIGGMIMGPIGAVIIKKVDKLLDGHIKSGLEMLVNNFSLGIIGAVLMVVGYLFVTPLFDNILAVFASAVQWTINRGLLPFTSFFIQPAQILFLNNAINHGILFPLGVEQALETGKSILYIAGADGGIWSGLVMAYCLFAKGEEKSSAFSALPIMVFGGIGEVAFPYALMHPMTLLGPIAGNIVGVSILQYFDGGAVAPLSPGSLIALILVSPKASMIVNLIAYFAGATVSCLVAGFFLIRMNKRNKLKGIEEEKTVEKTEKAESKIKSFSDIQMHGEFKGPIKKIVIACDAGMGSSAMGVSLFKNKINKSMLRVNAKHNSLSEIDSDADVIITTNMLFGRALSQCPNKEAIILGIDNLLNQEAYDFIIDRVKENNNEQG